MTMEALTWTFNDRIIPSCGISTHLITIKKMNKKKKEEEKGERKQEETGNGEEVPYLEVGWCQQECQAVLGPALVYICRGTRKLLVTHYMQSIKQVKYLFFYHKKIKKRERGRWLFTCSTPNIVYPSLLFSFKYRGRLLGATSKIGTHFSADTLTRWNWASFSIFLFPMTTYYLINQKEITREKKERKREAEDNRKKKRTYCFNVENLTCSDQPGYVRSVVNEWSNNYDGLSIFFQFTSLQLQRHEYHVIQKKEKNKTREKIKKWRWGEGRRTCGSVSNICHGSIRFWKSELPSLTGSGLLTSSCTSAK